MATTIEADYAIVGAGAMGLAFADVLVSHSSSAIVVLVDRLERPGGHWTAAYPHVRLHQPSVCYGVCSRELGKGRVDTGGGNAGLMELAAWSEVLHYFQEVVEGTLLPSGRVKYLAMHEYDFASGTARSLVSGTVTAIKARKIVDATYSEVRVPSMRPTPFPVASGVACLPPNALAEAAPGRRHFAVLGAGKTGIDACLWLLDRGVDPARITWVMPRDHWMFDRVASQTAGKPGAAAAAMAAATHRAVVDPAIGSPQELLLAIERGGELMRLDPAVEPSVFHCATVTAAELASLRTIKDVVRMGRVVSISATGIQLTGGTKSMPEGTLYVDCTANSIPRRPATPVFNGDRLTLQPVRTCQQVFSAALIAFIELTFADDGYKNKLTVPVPHPDLPLHYIVCKIATYGNEISWLQDPKVADWLWGCRLNVVAQAARMPKDEGKRNALWNVLRSRYEEEIKSLKALLAKAGDARSSL
ncbi:pyridine nucleotide-disulfide oxidoreductase-domain-containing protein [Hyaloraphidium curvatum]|nr:pyridine nucleotide-disulfide oxidoreductase-domain-containing protein [Hyaloraphidium curvatum]